MSHFIESSLQSFTKLFCCKLQIILKSVNRFLSFCRLLPKVGPYKMTITVFSASRTCLFCFFVRGVINMSLSWVGVHFLGLSGKEPLEEFVGDDFFMTQGNNIKNVCNGIGQPSSIFFECHVFQCFQEAVNHFEVVLIGFRIFIEMAF